VSFDGEAAIALEHAAGDLTGADLPTPVNNNGVLDWGPLVIALLDSDAPTTALAAGFHDALARAIAAVASRFEREHVALVGGCFQNRRLLESTAREVREIGLTPVWCQQIPPNDGGIAAGQVAIAQSKMFGA
jgi:hydrogenase maturation protein HypF